MFRPRRTLGHLFCLYTMYHIIIFCQVLQYIIQNKYCHSICKCQKINTYLKVLFNDPLYHFLNLCQV